MTQAMKGQFYGLIIDHLRKEGAKARRRAEACDRALEALKEGGEPAPRNKAKGAKAAKKRSHITPQGIKRIKAAQKARWAKVHKQQAELAKGGHK